MHKKNKMPIDPVTGSLLVAGAGLLGQGIGAGSQASINKKTRKWNEKMYSLQRADALADWNMQNSYNHPSSQMARLRDAGLNPNLVYGTGAVATGGQVRSTESKSWNPQPTRIDVGGAAAAGLAAWQQMQMTKATVDNLRVQNDVLKQESLLKAAQTIGALAGGKMTEFDLGVKQQIRDYTVDAARLSNQKVIADTENVQAETSLKLTQEDVARAMKQPNMEKVLQEIILIKKEQLLKGKQIDNVDADTKVKLKQLDLMAEEIHNKALDGSLKQFDLDLKNYRGTQSDAPKVIRWLHDAVRDVMGDGFYKKRIK